MSIPQIDLNTQIERLTSKCLFALEWAGTPKTITCMTGSNTLNIVYCKQAVESTMANLKREGYVVFMSSHKMHFKLHIMSRKRLLFPKKRKLLDTIE